MVYKETIEDSKYRAADWYAPVYGYGDGINAFELMQSVSGVAGSRFCRPTAGSGGPASVQQGDSYDGDGDANSMQYSNRSLGDEFLERLGCYLGWLSFRVGAVGSTRENESTGRKKRDPTASASNG